MELPSTLKTSTGQNPHSCIMDQEIDTQLIQTIWEEKVQECQYKYLNYPDFFWENHKLLCDLPEEADNKVHRARSEIWYLECLVSAESINVNTWNLPGKWNREKFCFWILQYRAVEGSKPKTRAHVPACCNLFFIKAKRISKMDRVQ